MHLSMRKSYAKPFPPCLNIRALMSIAEEKLHTGQRNRCILVACSDRVPIAPNLPGPADRFPPAVRIHSAYWGDWYGPQCLWLSIYLAASIVSKSALMNSKPRYVLRTVPKRRENVLQPSEPVRQWWKVRRERGTSIPFTVHSRYIVHDRAVCKVPQSMDR